MQDSTIPALSQVLEQCVRIGTVFLTAAYFVPMGLEYACMSAVFGIVAGEILSFVFVFFSYFYYKRKNVLTKKPSFSSGKTFLMITAMALPLTANRVTGSLLSTIENVLIPQRLALFGTTGSDAMGLYGALTGMAMPAAARLGNKKIHLFLSYSAAAACNNFSQ